MLRSAPLLVLAALAAALAPNTGAADPPVKRGQQGKRNQRTVLLLDTSRARVDPQLRRQVIDGLATALESKQGWISLRLPRRSDTFEAEIDSLLTQAREHSEQFHEQLARQALAKAEGVFRSAAAVTVAPLIKILLARARLHNDLGDMAAARADLARLIALSPERDLDAGVFPPALVKAHRKLRRTRRRQRGTIRVVTTPPRAEVWIDGRNRGRAPLSVAVVAGEHFVTVGPEGLRAGTTVTVVEGDAKPVNLKLPRHRTLTDAELRTTVKRAGARWVAAVELVQPLGEADRFRLRVRLVSGITVEVPKQLATKEVAGEGLDQAASALAARMRASMQPAPPRVVAAPAPAISLPVRPPPKRSSSVFTTWWFWTAVVAVVGGGTAAVVVLTQQDDPGVRLRLER